VVSFLLDFLPHSYTRSSSPMSATCLVYLILLHMIILITLGEEYKLWSSSSYIFLQPPVTLFLFGPNILLNTLFSNSHSLRSFLNVRDQVSYPYKTKGKIIVLYIRIFTFLDSRGDRLLSDIKGLQDVRKQIHKWAYDYSTFKQSC
jgi:hypothetical protein